MKKLVFFSLTALFMTSAYAQTESVLVEHFQKYYAQMRAQGDVNGVISALTHLQVLNPSQSRLDTIAYFYLQNNQPNQALETIGTERNVADSDLAVRVKGISLKTLNQLEPAIQQFEILYKRDPNPYLAYELANLKIQTGNSGAIDNIDYGLANATDEMKQQFFERQQPYEVPMKAAFTFLKGLHILNMDQSKVDDAIALVDQALQQAPNFYLAQITKEALQKRKNGAAEGSAPKE